MPEIINNTSSAQEVQGNIDEFKGLDSTKEIEPQSFDCKPFIGKEVFIESVEERKGSFGFFIKLLTEPITTLPAPKGSKEPGKEIRASRLFGLSSNDDGNLGWTEKSKLGVFLKKYNLKHYKEFLAEPVVKSMQDPASKETYRKITGNKKVKVIVQTVTGKDSKDYLSF